MKKVCPTTPRGAAYVVRRRTAHDVLVDQPLPHACITVIPNILSARHPTAVTFVYALVVRNTNPVCDVAVAVAVAVADAVAVAGVVAVWW